MIYLASPYSGTEEQQEKRYHEAMRCVASYRKATPRLTLFSPIVYCHEMAKRFDLGTDAEAWWNFNSHILYEAKALFVLCLLGWRESKGVTRELEYAKDCNILTCYLLPEDGEYVRLTEPPMA